MSERLTLVEVVQRAICCGNKDGSCDHGDCVVEEYGTTATRVVSQLRKRGLINAAGEKKLSEGT